MSIPEFIIDLRKNNNNIKSYFSDSDSLEKCLLELEDVIGMKKIKSQILKQIKTFISSKAKGLYKESDRKHCLLCGPPGCGKTTVGKILCKIWIAIGFIGRDSKGSKKFITFNKVQDELIRFQRREIRDYKDKVKACLYHMNNIGRIISLNKRCINSLIRIKDKHPHIHEVNELIRDIGSSSNIIDETNKQLLNISKQKTQDMKGFGIETEKEMMNTKEDPELPFYVYNRNDVVSRYVGDTAHRCTKAMNEALDGVAYFDEAYNLCNEKHGLSDSYGREALTTINQYMDEHSDKLIVVFAGYKEDIYNNLFRAQKGLESRFTHKFEIEKYTSDELTKIFIQRLKRSEWHIEESEQLKAIIKDNFTLFRYQGRDMDTLALYTKNIISERLYDDIIAGKQITNTISDLDIVRRAVDIFKGNTISASDREESGLERLAEILRQ